MFFGQYLLSKGAINREAFIDAIERQRSTNLSLVELAVRDGCLEPQRAESILTRYRTTDAGLEELCLEYGKIDREKLDELRRAQRSDWVRIGSALVAGGHLTIDQVEEQLAAFHEVQREANQQLEANFLACRDAETVKTVVELAVFHLKRFTDGPVNGGGMRRCSEATESSMSLWIFRHRSPRWLRGGSSVSRSKTTARWRSTRSASASISSVVTPAHASKRAASGSGPSRRSRPRVMNRPGIRSHPSVRG
jgi:hypothetical protein